MRRLICRMFGHDRVSWNSTTYSVNHYFSDGCQCIRCGALLYVWGPEESPYRTLAYTRAVKILGFVRAPAIQERGLPQ